MSVFTVTKSEAEAFKDFFPEDIYNNIGKENFYTLGAFDDEEFVAGVLQFFVGFDENKGTYSRVCYLYVPEEFADADIAFLLMDEYKNVVFESGISEDLVEVLDDSCVFVYATQAKELCELDSIKGALSKNIYSISFIDNLEFIKIKKQVANGAELEQKRFYEDEISSFYKAKDGCALLLVKKDAAENLVINFLGCDRLEITGKLKDLVSYSIKRAKDQYGEDKIIRIECKDFSEFYKVCGAIPEIQPFSISANS
jgi:hypothetical protein